MIEIRSPEIDEFRENDFSTAEGFERYRKQMEKAVTDVYNSTKTPIDLIEEADTTLRKLNPDLVPAALTQWIGIRNSYIANGFEVMQKHRLFQTMLHEARVSSNMFMRVASTNFLFSAIEDVISYRLEQRKGFTEMCPEDENETQISQLPNTAFGSVPVYIAHQHPVKQVVDTIHIIDFANLNPDPTKIRRVQFLPYSDDKPSEFMSASKQVTIVDYYPDDEKKAYENKVASNIMSYVHERSHSYDPPQFGLFAEVDAWMAEIGYSRKIARLLRSVHTSYASRVSYFLENLGLDEAWILRRKLEKVSRATTFVPGLIIDHNVRQRRRTNTALMKEVFK